CVVVGRPILRSVDSEVKGRVLSPESTRRREPSSWTQAGAVSGNLLLVHSACLILPGSKSTDNDHQGFPGLTHHFSQRFQGSEPVQSTSTRFSTPPGGGDGGCSFLYFFSRP